MTITVKQIKDIILDYDSKPLDCKDDPLALSWASYHAWQAGGPRWLALSEVTATERDHQLAQATRRYYAGKIAVQLLQGQPVSKFRQDLYELCSGGAITNGHRGMVFQLPYLYSEDQSRERLAERFRSVEFGQDFNRYLQVAVCLDLTPAEQLFVCSRKNQTDKTEYWFTDSAGLPYMIDVLHSNPLKTLVDSLYARPQLRLGAHIYRRTCRYTKLEYSGIIKPEVVA